MGPLTLPAVGPIYLDASAFIYSVERVEPYRELLEPMWRQVQAGQFGIVSSDLVVLETPDALHAASALYAGCTLFITNDPDFQRVEDLPIVVLDNLIKEESQI